MNWNTIEGKWDQLKGKVREQWGKFTDDDISAIGGKKDQLKGKLKEKYGYAEDRIDREIDNFCNTCEKTKRSDLH